MMVAIKHTSLTANELRKILRYEEQTGDFYWINCANNKQFLNGKKAGFARSGGGYISIKIGGVIYLAHRLAWLYMTGWWPKELDHINGIKHDNKWSNLREATVSQNQINRGEPSGKTSGLPKGVSRNPKRTSYKKFSSKITVNGKVVRLGWFATPELAHQAYVAASAKYFGDFAWYK